MKKIKYIIPVVSLFLLLSACEKSEKIDDFPLRPPKLVVNCYFTPDSIWQFQVSKSLSVLDNAKLSLVNGAKILLYKNSVLIDSVSKQNENYWYEIPENLPEEGAKYSIAVTAPKFKDTVRASNRLPLSVPIDTVSLTILDSSFSYIINPDGNYDEWGYLKGSFHVRFTDPAHVENYYELSAYYYDTVYFDETHTNYSIVKFYVSVTSDDPAVANSSSNSGGSLFLPDELFDGKTHTIALNFEDFGAKKERKYHIKMASLSKAAYLYRKTVQQYQTSQNDPFSEPVQIYSNIQHGYGIFAGISSVEKAVTM